VYKNAFIEKKLKTELIFSNIEEIFQVSSTLIDKISRKLEEWSLDSTIGDVFVEIVRKKKHKNKNLNNL
jgi:hypothetical protein